MRGIYKITNTNNNKCYIGKSENIASRIMYHIRSLRGGWNKNKHMRDSYAIYESGTFTIEIIEVLSEDEDINDREKYWIKYYNSNNREFGYNKTDGGDGGNSYWDHLSPEKQEELSRKQSERLKGEGNPNYQKHCFTDGDNIKYITDDEVSDYLEKGWFPGVPEKTRTKERKVNTGENNGFYGKSHSNETKTILSESRKGENNWNYGKTLMYKNDKQKYVSSDEVEHFLEDGWEMGMSPGNKEKLSKTKKGKKTNKHSPNAIKYKYNGILFYGWRAVKEYLNNNGYPTISETSIIKLAEGRNVRGYDDLIGKITIEE